MSELNYINFQFIGKCIYILFKKSNLPYICFRNRLAEQSKYMLPTNKYDSEIDEMGLTEGELEYMKEKQTLELPPNFFRRLAKSRRHTTLEFSGFNVRDSFPQNIVRMKSGEIVFCSKFLTPKQADGSVTISGYSFSKVQSNCILYECINSFIYLFIHAFVQIYI